MTLPTEAELDAELELAELEAALAKEHAFEMFVPYEPQLEFFGLGRTRRERLFMAGNQTGKSQSGAFEMVCHLTGIYPSWWVGKRFGQPIKAWAGGVTGTDVRDVMQGKLCGTPGAVPADYNGLIPQKMLIGRTLSHGVSDAFDSIRVKHITGGVSILGFKTYPQGRESWQGMTLDVVWLDEEPPKDIYDEGLTRLTGDGILYTTCTPLKGPTEFIRRFIQPADETSGRSRGVARMGLRHAAHFTAEQKEVRLAGYSARDRAARENGDPVLQGGRIFSAAEDHIKLIAAPGFLYKVPPAWKWIWGLDFGWAHPFAAALCAWDTEFDTFYVMNTLRMKEAIPLQHADAMKRIAANVPVAWPHDGTHTEKGSGDPLAHIYRKLGLNMLSHHATHVSGGYSVEAGLTSMDTYMTGGRFKVIDSCFPFFEEYRIYRYDDRPGKEGKIVKVNDDVLDAVRCAWMMRRYARAVPLGSKGPDKSLRRNRIAPGADETHWGM